jgi:hypothetical protein
MNDKYLEAHQTRSWPPPAYEVKLARTIEEIFARGHYELSELVSELNAAMIVSPDGGEWSEAAFVEQMRVLGA